MKTRFSPNVRISTFVRISTLFFLFLLAGSSIFAQSVCTITGTSPLNWVNPGPSCTQGGNAGSKSILVIPAGFTLNFDDVGDTWTGTGIVVDGTLNINKDVTINGSILVRGTGTVNLNGKLSLGTAANCGYGIGVQNGGKIDVGSTGSDRLSVCGADMMKGNGTCNSCGGTNSGTCAYNNNPYCEPVAGFTGPTGFGEGGYSSTLTPTLTTTLPIRLVSFSAKTFEDQVLLTWATEKEENFDRFEVERASSNLNFIKLTEVSGVGYNTESLQEYTWLDSNPFSGENYYRLKAVDLDGSFEYFKVVTASASGNRKFFVFPNPTKDKFVNYSVNFDNSGDDKIIVMDNMGNVVQQTTVSIDGKLVFGDNIKPGLYFVQYVSGDFRQIVRVTIR